MNLDFTYPYGVADSALATAYGVLGQVSGYPLDNTILNTLIGMINQCISDPVKYPFSGVATWIGEQDLTKLQPQTQEILQAIAKM